MAYSKPRTTAEKVAALIQEIMSVIKGRLGQKNPHKVYLAIVLLRQVKFYVQPRFNQGMQLTQVK